MKPKLNPGLSKHVLKSKQFWIGLTQVAGGLSTGFLTGNWAIGIPQAVGGLLAIIDRIFTEPKAVHVKKPKELQDEV
jgi:hypothetical protein